MLTLPSQIRYFPCSHHHVQTNEKECTACGLTRNPSHPRSPFLYCETGSCQRSYHLACLNPPLREKDIDRINHIWTCPDCDAVSRFCSRRFITMLTPTCRILPVDFTQPLFGTPTPRMRTRTRRNRARKGRRRLKQKKWSYWTLTRKWWVTHSYVSLKRSQHSSC
jgi:hypothetical protein